MAQDYGERDHLKLQWQIIQARLQALEPALITPDLMYIVI